MSAKPHIHRHDGYWWVCPWRGSNYGVAAQCLRDAWKRWEKHPWLGFVMEKGNPTC